MNMSNDPIGTAGVAVVRDHDGDLEVLWSRRPAEQGFLGGFHGFPAGRIVESDREVPLASGDGPFAPEERFYGGVAREFFEETGLLVSTDGVIAAERDDDETPMAPFEGDWSDCRHRVTEGDLDFGELLEAAGLAIDVDRFEPVGRWPSPDWATLETETEFFVLSLSETHLARLPEWLETAEHEVPEWIRPERALERWRRADVLLSTPIRLMLERLDDAEPGSRTYGRCLPTTRIRRRLDTEMLEVHRGVRLLPLATPTLPPATHTNCYVVGDDTCIVIDPGSSRSDALDLLFELLEGLESQGRTIRAVVPTHHHGDHVGGIELLLEAFDLELWTHPETVSHLEGLEPDRWLEDGDRLVLGESDAFEVLETPGHARDHVALYHEPSRGLFAGDVVAGEGTIVIDPPDGDMGDYLSTLRRLRDLNLETLFPGHGSPVTDPDRLLERYLEHRRDREEQVWRALQSARKPREAGELVPTVYEDAPRAVWPMAARSLLAHLIHLCERGRAERRGEAFVAIERGEDGGPGR
jgi:glyoxylase-like metal-dependent hydrolase (beta-lactamase superfamily II)/8-oxo-dGTP pyrophosphatase MutT (NUDIX family)